MISPEMAQIAAAFIVGILTIVAYALPYYLETRRRRGRAAHANVNGPQHNDGARSDDVLSHTPRSRDEYVAKLYDQFTSIGMGLGIIASTAFGIPQFDASAGFANSLIDAFSTMAIRAGVGAVCGTFAGVLLAKLAERVVRL